MIYESFIVKILLQFWTFFQFHLKKSRVYYFIKRLDHNLVYLFHQSETVCFLTGRPRTDQMMGDSLFYRAENRVIGWLSGVCHHLYEKIERFARWSLIFQLIQVLIKHLDLLICLTVFAVAFLPTMLVAVMIAGIIVLFVIRTMEVGTADFVKIPLSIWIIAFAIVVIYSAASSFTFGSSLQSALMYLLYLIFVYVIVNTLNTKEKIFRAIHVFLFAGLMVALYGVYQKMTGTVSADAWVDADMFGSITSRVYSTFDNPNVLGEFLILLIPISFSLIYQKDRAWWYKLLVLGVTGVMGICLIYTESRGAWLGLVAGMAFFVIVSDRRLIVPAVIFVLLIPFLMPSVMNRFMSIGNLADSSSNYRLSIIIGSLGIIKEYWLSGIGLGLEPFALIYPQHSLSAAYALHSHNYYLQLLIETGIAGFLVMLFLVVSFYRNIFHKCADPNTQSSMRFLLMGIVAGTLAYFVQGMVENLWFNYRVMLCFWMVLGIGMAGVQND